MLLHQIWGELIHDFNAFIELHIYGFAHISFSDTGIQ